MALYLVERNAPVAPGEFVSAYVIAGGTGQAAKAVAHMAGVITRGVKRNVVVRKVDTTDATRVLSTYFDESPTLDDAASDEVPAFTY